MKNVAAFSLLLAVIVMFGVAGCENNGDQSGPDDSNQTEDVGITPDDGDVSQDDLGAYDAMVEDALSCTPDPIDFGLVAVGQSRMLDVVIMNVQTAPITITDVYLDMDSAGFSLVDFVGGESGVLNTSDGLALQVRFMPTAAGLQTSSIHVVGLVDGLQRMWAFQVTGQGLTTAGVLEVMPESIDLGWVATGTSKTAVLTVKNIGNESLNVQSVEFKDVPEGDLVKFEVTKVGESSPPFGDGLLMTLESQDFDSIHIKFSNNGPDTGDYTANLVIKTGAPDYSTVTVHTLAKSSHGGVCDAQIVPKDISFGLIPVGFQDTVEMRIVNIGTGSCRLAGRKIADCTAGPDETVTCPDPMQGNNSSLFTFSSNMPSGLIGPGIEATLQVAASIPSPADSIAFSALVSFEVLDVNSGESFMLPDCGPGDCMPNIGAAGGNAEVNWLPKSIDFGKVGLGCASTYEQVCIFNVDGGPLDITNILSDDCGLAGVMLFDTPSTYPAVVEKDSPVCFNARYTPDAVGADSCTLTVDVTDIDTPQISIPLTGEGVAVAPQVDDIVVTGSEPVDPESGDVQFDLSRLVDVNGVTVAVDNGGDGVFVDCPSGWTVDELLNAVMIDPEGACAVEPGDHVRVTYDVLCLLI